MQKENWALSRMPWVASNYWRPCFQGGITGRGLPYYLLFIKFLSSDERDDYSQNICMFSGGTVIISPLPCRPTKRKINIYSGPQDFYWLHMQAANPQEISIWNHLTSTLLPSTPTMRHLDISVLRWDPRIQVSNAVYRSSAVVVRHHSEGLHPRMLYNPASYKGSPTVCSMWSKIKLISLTIHFVQSPTSSGASETCGVIL